MGLSAGGATLTLVSLFRFAFRRLHGFPCLGTDVGGLADASANCLSSSPLSHSISAIVCRIFFSWSVARLAVTLSLRMLKRSIRESFAGGGVATGG